MSDVGERHDLGAVAAASLDAATVDAATADAAPADGRVARRERNVAAVLDAVIEMFTEGEFAPSIEKVANRTGLSLRSVYRYFPDPTAMHDAAVARHRAQVEPLAALPDIGVGSLAERIERLVDARLRLYAHVGATFRATALNAPRSPRLKTALERGRDELRTQIEQHFAPELDALGADRKAVATAVDALTLLDSIDLLHRDRGLDADDVAAALTAALTRLLGGTRG